MAQVKEQNPAQAQNNPNRNSESGGEKRTRTRRPYYNRRPRRAQQPNRIFADADFLFHNITDSNCSTLPHIFLLLKTTKIIIGVTDEM